jgi:hypothetical protein
MSMEERPVTSLECRAAAPASLLSASTERAGTRGEMDYNTDRVGDLLRLVGVLVPASLVGVLVGVLVALSHLLLPFAVRLIVVVILGPGWCRQHTPRGRIMGRHTGRRRMELVRGGLLLLNLRLPSTPLLGRLWPFVPASAAYVSVTPQHVL